MAAHILPGPPCTTVLIRGRQKLMPLAAPYFLQAQNKASETNHLFNMALIVMFIPKKVRHNKKCQQGQCTAGTKPWVFN